MPLERAKDSYVTLTSLADSSAKLALERAKDSYVNLTKLTAESGAKLDSFLEIRDSAGTFSNSGDSAITSKAPVIGCEDYWKSGKDWHEHVDILPLRSGSHAKKKGSKKCFPFLAFCDPQNSDFGDDGSEQQDISFHTVSEHSTQNGGVLRRASLNVQVVLGVNKGERSSFHPKMYGERSPSAIPKHVRFASTKSQVKICPGSCMSPEEKETVWWQLKDFEAFKAEIMVLVQSEEDKSACSAWLAKHQPVLGTASKPKQSRSWWHKYGDSRRGLEKYASSNQMAQTLESYKEAIWHVLNEQRNQGFLFRRKDPEKLARVYREYTAWSRDLALAAAASDADAVEKDFDDARRKSREFFLLKQIFSNDGKIHEHQPDFMVPTGLRHQGYLDEHQSNQISS